MSLTYAGVGIPLSPPELEDRLSRVHPHELFQYANFWNFEGYGLQNLPTPTLPNFPPIKPGVLHWPTGATRPAFFFAVVNTDRLNDIRGAVGDPMVAQSLQMNDGRSGKTITAEMLLLPALSLNQLGHDLTDGWLLLLADARFWWQFRYGDITDRESWTALLDNLAANLGVTIDVDSIDAAYLPPTEKWLGFNRPSATVLDAALAQIGHRLVANLDGTFRTVTWQTAKLESDAYLTDAHVISGGFLDPTDIGRYLPRSVSVFFASGGGGCCAPAPYVLPRGLLALQNASGLFAASGLTGASGNVYGDAIFDGTNAVALGSYATAAATDWYGWRAPDSDVVFPGVEPFAPTGWEEFVEWTYQKRDDGPYASTLVRRGEFDALPSGSWEVGDCCEFFVKISGGSDAAGYSGTRVVLLGPNNWVVATAPEPLEFDGNIWRAPSNQVSPILPPIGEDQVVRVWRSPTLAPIDDVPQYECGPVGSQNRVTLLDENCVQVDVWGRDLYSTPSSPPTTPVVSGTTTTSLGAGVIRAGTQVRFLTRNVTGGESPHTTVVNFGDFTSATGDDLLHTYASAGVFQPYAQYFNATGGTSDATPILGGDGRGLLIVLDDPGLALTIQNYRLEEDFVVADDTPVLIPDLTAWVSAGCSYDFEASIPLLSDATAGVQVGIGGTATIPPPPPSPAPPPTPPTPDLYFQTFLWGDANAVPAFSRIQAMDTTVSEDGSTEYFATIKGSIRASGSGTIGPIIAQAVTDAATTMALVGATFTVRLTQPSLP